jgi:rhodanese-related sulfurtransferase
VLDDGVPGVSAIEAQELVNADAMLLDVREDDEWAAGHAPQAVHMAMSRISREFETLPKERTIVCVCHVGARSAAVVAALNHAGWRAVNVDGGMEAWVDAGLPVVDGAGEPGTVI